MVRDPRTNEYFVKAIEYYPLREVNPASVMIRETFTGQDMLVYSIAMDLFR